MNGRNLLLAIQMFWPYDHTFEVEAQHDQLHISISLRPEQMAQTDVEELTRCGFFYESGEWVAYT